MPPKTTAKTAKPKGEAIAPETESQGPEHLSTFSADIIGPDGTFRAFLLAKDEDQARELLSGIASHDANIRGVWKASDRPTILGIFKPEHLS